MKNKKHRFLLLLIGVALNIVTVQSQNSTGAILLESTRYRSIPAAPDLPIEDLPPKVDFSAEFPKPRSQGQQGSCTAWAAAYLKSFQEGRERGWDFSHPNEIISPAYIYNSAVERINCDTGTKVIDALNLLITEGACTLELFPYRAEDCTTLPSEYQKSRAKFNRIANYWRVNVQSVSAIKSQLAGGFPILGVIDVSQAFNRINDSSIFKNSTRESRRPHAVVVIGYDDSKNAFRILNSWGEGWGDGGYAWIDYGTFAEISYEGYILQDIVLESGRTEETLQDNNVFLSGGRVHGPEIKGIRLGMSRSMVLSRLDSNNVFDPCEGPLITSRLLRDDYLYFSGKVDLCDLIHSKININGLEGVVSFKFNDNIDYLEQILISSSTHFSAEHEFNLKQLNSYLGSENASSLFSSDWVMEIHADLESQIQGVFEISKNDNSKFTDSAWSIGRDSINSNGLGPFAPECAYTGIGRSYWTRYYESDTKDGNVKSIFTPSYGSVLKNYFNFPKNEINLNQYPDGSKIFKYTSRYSGPNDHVVYCNYNRFYIQFIGDSNTDLVDLNLFETSRGFQALDQSLLFPPELETYKFPDEDFRKWPDPNGYRNLATAILQALIKKAENSGAKKESTKNFSYSGGFQVSQYPMDEGDWTIDSLGLRRDDIYLNETPLMVAEGRLVSQVKIRHSDRIGGRGIFAIDRPFWSEDIRTYKPTHEHGIFFVLKAKKVHSEESSDEFELDIK